MRYFLVAALFAVTASSASAATLLINGAPIGTAIPTVPAFGQAGAAGMLSYTFSLQTEAGETFRGLDATFTGAMSQVNPFGLATILTDNNGVFPATTREPAEDSQFLFASGTVLTIGAKEGPNILKAAISGLADNGLPNPAPFARIVTDATCLSVTLAFDLAPGAEPVRFAGYIGCIPEPTTCVLAGLALVGAAARRRVRASARRFQAPNGHPPCVTSLWRHCSRLLPRLYLELSC